MENVVKKSEVFFREVLYYVLLKDKLHFNSLLQDHYLEQDFAYFKDLICEYFLSEGISSETVADDYLMMISDMRRESMYFIEHGEYFCKSETEAQLRVYDRDDKMRSYMNALMLSQVLWKHHYLMLKAFKCVMSVNYNPSSPISILDVGAGHALYSIMATDCVPGYKSLGIIDLSSASLDMASQMLKNVNHSISKINIKDFKPSHKFDLIIMGEILEHTENPAGLLRDVKSLLASDGNLWLTVPTNAPAIDHIYLFRNEIEVEDMIKTAGFNVVQSIIVPAKGSITKLIGAHCKP